MPSIKNKDIIRKKQRKGRKLMKKLNKVVIKIMGLIVLVFGTYMNLGQVQATPDEKLLQEQIEYYARNVDVNNITKEDILNIYDEVIAQYSPENIANMIEQNEIELQEQGINKEVIKAGVDFIRTTDTQSIRNMIENDIDIDEIQEKINQGYTLDRIVGSMIEETPTTKKLEIVAKVVLANKVIKTIVIILIVLYIYGTILRWCLYTKAGKQGWAAIVPVYRQIVMYQVCGLSPWLMLLWFVPIFGWLAMFVIAIMKRFCLAKEFGKGTLFGLGLLFFELIFQSILAFHPKIEYDKKEA